MYVESVCLAICLAHISTQQWAKPPFEDALICKNAKKKTVNICLVKM